MGRKKKPRMTPEERRAMIERRKAGFQRYNTFTPKAEKAYPEWFTPKSKNS